MLTSSEYISPGTKTLDKGLINPKGDPNSNSYLLKSSYGWDGYGRINDHVHDEIQGSAHTGADISGVKGERINSVTNGTFIKGSITYGADTEIRMPVTDKLAKSKIQYLEVETGPDGKVKPAGYYQEGSSEPMKREDIMKIDPQAPDSPPMKRVGVLYDKDTDTYYRRAFVGGTKVNLPLTSTERAAMQMPEEARKNPALLGGNGNSISMLSKVGGIDYKVSYLHLDEVPSAPPNNEFIRGQQIGVMGTTGSSTGYHLHVEVTTTTKPDIPNLYYDPIINANSEVTGYRINSDYFMREMLKSERP